MIGFCGNMRFKAVSKSNRLVSDLNPKKIFAKFKDSVNKVAEKSLLLGALVLPMHPISSLTQYNFTWYRERVESHQYLGGGVWLTKWVDITYYFGRVERVFSSDEQSFSLFNHVKELNVKLEESGDATYKSMSVVFDKGGVKPYISFGSHNYRGYEVGIGFKADINWVGKKIKSIFKKKKH